MKGIFLENFFENFMRQVKKPTRFEFFRVPAEKFKKVVQKLQDAFTGFDAVGLSCGDSVVSIFD
ncbi:MAG: hypothetical protein LBB73_07655 [Dysgonamonadaceae bacterium]|jgi:hypothetical protein|nr:hypothetical protein [Dysgonamonadaceae bacterium]